MAKQVSYTDKDGSKKTGYIENGVTYTDSGLTTRVADGSVVETDGGTFYKSSEKPYGVEITAPGENDDSFSLHGKNYKTHYNQDGTAFVDEAHTVRVPTGTGMIKDGSSYYNDSDYGMVPTPSGARNEYINNVHDINEYVTAAANAERRAIDARTQSRIDAIKSREREVLMDKSKADRASYNSYLQSVNPYGANAQAMARLGLSNSGFAESSLVNLGTVYQQALAGNEQARATAMLELKRLTDQAIADGDRAKYEVYANLYSNLYTGNLNAAQIAAQLGMQGASMLDAKNVRNDEIARTETHRAEDIAREETHRAEDIEREETHRAEDIEREETHRDEDMAFQREMAQVSNEREAAQLILKYVMSGTYTISQIANMLGIPEGELREILQAYM